jgi:aminoglycoside phosphotransferase (APT) family kinase protein
MHVLCEDESVIGRAFYVMECVDGRVMWDQSLPDMSREQRGAIYDEMNRVMASLHTVRPDAAIGLGDYGKPGNYFERQIGRWSKQYVASITQPIPRWTGSWPGCPKHSGHGARRVDGVDRAWRLPARQPDVPPDRAAGAGRAGLGTVHAGPSAGRLQLPLHGLAHPARGCSAASAAWMCRRWAFPDEDDYIARYCERTGFATPGQLKADWNFYLAYNMFRLAAILQGIAKRVETGTASSAQAVSSAAGARPLAELAWRFARRH